MRRKTAVTVLGVIVAVGVVAFAVLQFFRPDTIGNNPPTVRAAVWPSAQSEAIARRACYDCHSNESVYPWYAWVMPVSLLLAHDIETARSVMNFSEWEPGRIPSELVKYALESGQMPLPQYLLLHPEARLSDPEKQALIEAFGQVK